MGKHKSKMAKVQVHVEQGIKHDESSSESEDSDEGSIVDRLSEEDPSQNRELEKEPGSESHIEDRLSGEDADSESGNDSDTNEEVTEKSGMADVLARILSKDTSKSNRLLLAKGKTDKEIVEDIKARKRKRDIAAGIVSSEESTDKTLRSDKEELVYKEEKRKIWEGMSRKMPNVLDIPRETKLRKIATQGVVQLFRSVNEHQKVMKKKISAVGSSERKKDKVISEMTHKGKFLDLLKPRGPKATKSEPSSGKFESSGKWKILQDDFMMGAQLKDWDKQDDDEQPMDDADVLSDND